MTYLHFIKKFTSPSAQTALLYSAMPNPELSSTERNPKLLREAISGLDSCAGWAHGFSVPAETEAWAAVNFTSLKFSNGGN